MRWRRFIPVSLRLWHRWLAVESHPLVVYFDDRMPAKRPFYPAIVPGLLIAAAIALFFPRQIPLTPSTFLWALGVVIAMRALSVLWLGLRMNYFTGGLFRDELIDMLPDGRGTVMNAAAVASLRSNDLALTTVITVHVVAVYMVTVVGLITAEGVNHSTLFFSVGYIIYDGLRYAPLPHGISFLIVLFMAWDFRQAIVIAIFIGARTNYHNRLRVWLTLLLSQLTVLPLVIFTINSILIEWYLNFAPLSRSQITWIIIVGAATVRLQELLIYTLHHPVKLSG